MYNRVVDRASQRQPEASDLLCSRRRMAFPSVKCLRNKKVPFSPPWLHTCVEKNCGLNFYFLTQKWLGF